MKLRSGKYKGQELSKVQEFDSRYILWVRENRPEMLKEFKPKKSKKLKIVNPSGDEESEERISYKKLEGLSWSEAFF